MNSLHKIEVGQLIYKGKHPNADNLSLFEIFNYPYVGNTNDWQECIQNGSQIVAFIPPDTLVNTCRPEFLFLEAKFDEFSNKKSSHPIIYARIKGKRLRGELSYGLCVKAPEGAKIGDDLAEYFGSKHYEPPIDEGNNSSGKVDYSTGGDNSANPGINVPYYDIESFMRFGKLALEQGEKVILFEKVHGENGCFVYLNGEFHCKSRNNWKKEFPSPPKFDKAQVLTELILKGVPDEYLDIKLESIKAKIEGFVPKQNSWWKTLRENPPLMNFLQKNEGLVVFGEVAGKVKGYPYGYSKEKPGFFGFDMWKEGKFLDVLESEKLAQENSIPWVPKIAELPFDFDELLKYASGTTRVPNAKHQIEGVVVRVPKERFHSSCGRVILKLISPDFYNG